jgi:PKD repeat protein
VARWAWSREPPSLPWSWRAGAHTGEAPAVDFEAWPYGDGIVEFYDLSTDREDDIVSRSWSFGDGSGSTEANPVHTYPVPGTYMVTLTVTDGAGHSANATRAVTAE